jgi:hypothetical protein
MSRAKHPEVGHQVVFFDLGVDDTTPESATITAVTEERLVDLSIVDSNGKSRGMRAVPLVPKGEPRTIHGPVCEWDPPEVPDEEVQS